MNIPVMSEEIAKLFLSELGIEPNRVVSLRLDCKYNELARLHVELYVDGKVASAVGNVVSKKYLIVEAA